MRKQLRPFWDDDKLAEIYRHPFEHTNWDAHVERVANTVFTTVETIEKLPAETFSPKTIGDFAAGDGAIATRIGEHFEAKVILGDMTPRHDIVGPIERTLRNTRPVDLLVMTEILEHVKNPDMLLVIARRRARMLVLSTPLGEDDDRNEEHYWGWDDVAIREMLTAAGWTAVKQWNYTPECNDYYTFQNWIAI